MQQTLTSLSASDYTGGPAGARCRPGPGISRLQGWLWPCTVRGALAVRGDNSHTREVSSDASVTPPWPAFPQSTRRQAGCMEAGRGLGGAADGRRGDPEVSQQVEQRGRPTVPWNVGSARVGRLCPGRSSLHTGEGGGLARWVWSCTGSTRSHLLWLNSHIYRSLQVFIDTSWELGCDASPTSQA